MNATLRFDMEVQLFEIKDPPKGVEYNPDLRISSHRVLNRGPEKRKEAMDL